jgi:hypothetical protein
MGKDYKDRYGIHGKSVTSLLRRYYRYLSDSDWEKADDFLKWCSENGWKKGLRLYKTDASLPHGPSNSYFKQPPASVRANRDDVRRRKEERKKLVSPFCEGCKTGCRNTAVGCDDYRAWWKKNWDQNICVAPKKPEQKPMAEGPQIFRYEHPDLVREGIVFEGSGSM